MTSITIKVIINTTTTQRNNHNNESLRAIKLEKKKIRKKELPELYLLIALNCLH